ncbi:hypothetical protein GOBAR_DD19337 [Gossypium barbadense]|nr:hypothetical protein GOBAR_DD19337 [Gossypium barbadense]
MANTNLPRRIIKTGKLLREADKESGHKKTITSLTKSADGSHFLTGSLDKSAKLWDTRRLTLIKTYVTKRPVNAVAMSPLLDHVKGQPESIVQDIENMVRSYIEKQKRLSALLNEDPAIMERQSALAKRLELYRSAQAEIDTVAWSK